MAEKQLSHQVLYFVNDNESYFLLVWLFETYICIIFLRCNDGVDDCVLCPQDISRRNDIIKNEKIERAIPSIPSSNNLANITVIDVEEYMDPLPDYVKQTEAMLEEMEAMVCVPRTAILQLVVKV